jgi:hypothetical protein
MSINKVLNRPMFRETALKKGHLKPIKARIGTMVGLPTGGSTAYNPNRLPVTIPGQGPFTPKTPNIFQRGLGAIKKGGVTAFGLPAYAGYTAMSEGLNALGLRDRPEVTVPLSLAAGYGATRLPISAALAGTGFIPGAIGVAGIEGLAALTRAGVRERERIKAMSPAEYEEFKRMNEIRALEGEAGGFSDEELFGKFVPKEKLPSVSDVKPKTNVEKRKKFRSQRPETESIDQLTTADNKATVDNQLIDLDKVVKNQRPRMDEIAGGGPTEPKKPEQIKTVTKTEQEEEKKTDTQANASVVTAGAKTTLDKPGKITAADGTQVTDSVIERAKQIRKELMAGQSSQAKLVFLSNLASGLMSGTTSKGGIGGALEVFGKAIGPAVNNYAAIKLKENELENEFMSDALELAADEFEARNAILEAPDFPDATAGIIQFSDDKGNVRNMSARQLKDGTIQIAVPGQTDQFGRQLFQTAPVGTFDRFVDAKYATKEQGETLRNLSGKYKAYNLGRRTIDILREAEGTDKKFAGPAGRFNLFTTRLGDALDDLGMSFAGSKEEGLRQIEELKDDYVRDLVNDGMSEDEARNFLDKNFGKTDKLFADTLKSMGMFRDETDAANLERLAINETILTYALANSLKDKDRLTQKDIEMAKDLVNIFPLLRGQKQVIKSLEAVNETILADISRLENDYQFSFFGDSSTIDNYRRKYGIMGPEAVSTNQIVNPYKDQSTQELLEAF